MVCGNEDIRSSKIVDNDPCQILDLADRLIAGRKDGIVGSVTSLVNNIMIAPLSLKIPDGWVADLAKSGKLLLSEYIKQKMRCPSFAEKTISFFC